MILALMLAALTPYESLVCARDPHPVQCRRELRIIHRVCGPEGANDWDDRTGPVCERNGWDGRRYVEEPRR